MNYQTTVSATEETKKQKKSIKSKNEFDQKPTVAYIGAT